MDFLLWPLPLQTAGGLPKATTNWGGTWPSELPAWVLISALEGFCPTQQSPHLDFSGFYPGCTQVNVTPAPRCCVGSAESSQSHRYIAFLPTHGPAGCREPGAPSTPVPLTIIARCIAYLRGPGTVWWHFAYAISLHLKAILH